MKVKKSAGAFCERRLELLRGYLPWTSDAAQPLNMVAKRALKNMTMSVTELSEALHAPLSTVLKYPLPFDSANQAKQTLMPELMPSVGDIKLADRAWEHLSSASMTTAQATQVVLVTGVSGKGKTKAAYDIGRTAAFVVMQRVVERDCFTAPWEAFRTFAMKVVSTAAGDAAGSDVIPLAERVSLKTALLVLLVAHMEYAVAVSEAAVSPYCATALNKACAASEGDRTRVLRELVLRAQRNGLAYTHIASFFCGKLRQLLGAPGAIGAEGELLLSESSALGYLEEVRKRAKVVWGDSCDDKGVPRIVWAHDEVQALLSIAGLPTDLFDGVYSSQADSDVASPSPRVRRGCFYGLLVAIRDIISHMNCGHLLLGNALELSQQLLGRHSPAQGMASCVEEAVNLTAGDISKLLAMYLMPEAMAGADEALLEQLRGRALFVSQFWSNLVFRCSKATSAENPASLVRSALSAAVTSATDEAAFRISQLWEWHTPDVVSGQVPSRLLRHLFHESVMASGVGATIISIDTTRMRAGLVEAIQRGVLNAEAGSTEISLGAEPCTAAALQKEGMRRLRTDEDGVKELLAARMTEPPGAENADLGPAQEACLAWELVRRCLVRRAPMALGELLKPYFARVECTVDVGGNVHPGLLPAACDEYEVALTGGHRADGPAWRDKCPLELLQTTPTVLVHHPPDRIGGADIMFLVRHIDTGEGRPVLLQLKNRATGSLSDALRSLNIAKWYPDGRGDELRAHAHLRAVLEARPQWALPIRVVATARPVGESVLLGAAWLNRAQLADAPVLFLQLTPANMGVDIAPRGAVTSYGTTSDWPQLLWPLPVTRHWDSSVPALPMLAPCPAVPVAASRKLKLTSRAPKDAMEARVREVVREAEGDFESKRHRRTMLGFHRVITVTFTHAMAAFEVFRQSSEGTLIAGGTAITAVFVP